MGAPAKNSVSINSGELLGHYLAGRHDQLAVALLRVLVFLDGVSYLSLTAPNRGMLDLFVEHLLFFFTKPDLKLSDKHAENFVRLSPAISNVVAISSFRSTDPQLAIIRAQQNNLVRILPLLSPRNRERFDYTELFRLHPHLTSLWYAMYFQTIEAPATELILDNLTRHLAHIDPNYTYIGPEVTFAYSFSTYIDTEGDRAQKQGINAMIRRLLEGVKIVNRPAASGARHIAIVTGRWIPTSSVYKAMYGLVAALRQDYRLTLIELRESSPLTDRSLFDDVKLVKIDGNQLIYSEVMNNDFDLVFYPDLGMGPEERYLANLRLAPVQVMGLGHSVSTFGTEIDYFISGKDAELAEAAAENYSERLVLIPGTGLHPTWPHYERQRKQPDSDTFTINCSWYAQRCRYPHLALLKRILAESERPIRFRIFAGIALHRHNAFIPFLQEVSSVLGAENIEVLPELKFAEYMAKLEEGEFGIDSFPIGGYNTVIDSLQAGRPFVSLEGTKFYNRVGSAVLRHAGLKELITHDEEEYVELVLKLIHNDKVRARLTQKIAKLDLDQLLAEPESPRYFKKAIDHLIANHARLKADWEKGKRAPLVIK